jgi:hypothetical protein
MLRDAADPARLATLARRNAEHCARRFDPQQARAGFNAMLKG